MADWGIGAMSDHGTKCAGHEGAGVIVKVGDQVQKLKVGQRAGFKPVADVCGICELCRTGKECYCADAVLTGFHTDGKLLLGRKEGKRILMCVLQERISNTSKAPKSTPQ